MTQWISGREASTRACNGVSTVGFHRPSINLSSLVYHHNILGRQLLVVGAAGSHADQAAGRVTRAEIPLVA